MFEVGDWAANKTADDLSQKLFTKKNLKRKHDDSTGMKTAKLQKVDAGSGRQKAKKRKNRDVKEADRLEPNPTKYQKKTDESSTDSTVSQGRKHVIPQQTKTTKVKSSNRKKIGGIPNLVKGTKAESKPKSPRNKYKHLAIKRQEQAVDQSNLSGKKEIKRVENTTDVHQKVLLSGNVQQKDVKVKPVREKKRKQKLKESGSKSADTNGLPNVTIKETKRRRKRKKKNNPKKNKYRHLVLAKSMEQEAGDVKTPHPSGTREHGQKIEKSPGKVKAFDVTKLKQALSTSVDKSIKEDKNVDSTGTEPHAAKPDNVKTKQAGTKSREVKQGGKEKEELSSELTLKEKVTAKLNSARFRYLNEQLYTQTGQDSYQLFAEDNDAFRVYHDGFKNQVEKWPCNPLDTIIKYIGNKPASVTVADFGCGEAQLAQSVPNKVHSFDLVALNDYVTPCDMAKVPLKDETVDICVFCLSLMGTNLGDYLREANRILKPGGILKIAEVSSRFESLPEFTKSLKNVGFKKTNQNTSNKMFVMVDFKKVSEPKHSSPELSLKPCLYKKR